METFPPEWCIKIKRGIRFCTYKVKILWHITMQEKGQYTGFNKIIQKKTKSSVLEEIALSRCRNFLFIDVTLIYAQ